MAQNVVINGVTYPAVEVVALTDSNGNTIPYYPDAVCYVPQTLTEAQKAQARQNIGAQAELTEADKEALVQQVITALGTPVFGTVKEDKKITLSTEHLADDTYYVGYEDEDGDWVEIGAIVKGEIGGPVALEWRNGVTINSTTGAEESYGTSMSVTQMIDIQDGATYTAKVNETQWSKVHTYWYDGETYLGRLEHQCDMGAPSSSNVQIPAGGSTVLTPLQGATKFKVRLNHAQNLTQERIAWDWNNFELIESY